MAVSGPRLRLRQSTAGEVRRSARGPPVGSVDPEGEDPDATMPRRRLDDDSDPTPNRDTFADPRAWSPADGRPAVDVGERAGYVPDRYVPGEQRGALAAG